MKSIKLTLLLVVMIAGSLPVEAWQTRAGKRVSPRAVVLNLYNQHKRQSPFFQTRSRALVDRYFTRELADLLWQDARSSRDEVGALDGDPLFNAQDMQIKNFSVRERGASAGTADVVASFENFGERHEVSFRLVPAGMSWKIADITYDDGTTLIGILKRDRGPAARGIPLKLYLVALGDNGKRGKKIGCGDSLVPVVRTISNTVTPLSAAITQLLATPRHPAENPKLENFWKGNNLKLTSVVIRGNTATIHISGEVFVAGICDIPRIESQMEQTARQFPNVKKVRVFIGGRTMRDALR